MKFDEFRNELVVILQERINHICMIENCPKYIVCEDNVDQVMKYLIHKDIGIYYLYFSSLYESIVCKHSQEKRFYFINEEDLSEEYGLALMSRCPFVTVKKSKKNPFETEKYIDKKASDEAFMLLEISMYSIFPVEASAKSICEFYDVSLAGAECYKNFLRLFKEWNKDILNQEKRIYMIEGKRRLAIEE